MSAKVREIFVKCRRLEILSLLAGSKGYYLNLSILQTALNAAGLNTSRDGVEGECAWLAEQGLVWMETIAVQDVSVGVAHLTERGLEIAQGKGEHPGVDKPRPRRF